MKAIAYHGSVEDNLEIDKEKAFYLTDSYDLAKHFAYRDEYADGSGLYDDEKPVVYTYELDFKNPYYMTQEEYNLEGQDSNIDLEKWLISDYDGIIIEAEGYATYYICFKEGTYKLIDKKILPYKKLDEGKDNKTNKLLKKYIIKMMKKSDKGVKISEKMKKMVLDYYKKKGIDYSNLSKMDILYRTPEKMSNMFIDFIKDKFDIDVNSSNQIIKEGVNEEFTPERFNQIVELLITGVNDEENVWNVISLSDIAEYLNNNPKVLAQVKQLIGFEEELNINYIVDYINDKLRHNRYPDNKDLIYKILYKLVYETTNKTISGLIDEFKENNLIYREIWSDSNPEELLNLFSQYGVGNCWTNDIESAYSYNGSESRYRYLMTAEVNVNSVDWIMTGYLRVVAPQEQEIRLKKAANVKLVDIKYNDYEESGYHNIISGKDVPNALFKDIIFRVGEKFSYQNVMETLKEEVVGGKKIKNAEDVSYLYKNPTLKELRDDGNTEYRVIVTTNNKPDYYFADDNWWIHDDITQMKNIDEDFTDKLFYNIKTNTFHMDFTTDSKEEYDNMYKEVNDSLRNDEYIKETFGDFKFNLFSKIKLDTDTPLDETVKIIDDDDEPTEFGIQNYNADTNYGIKLIIGNGDMVNYCKNHDSRVVYDIDNDFYIVGDTYNYIHMNIKDALLQSGYKLSDNLYLFRTQTTDDWEERIISDNFKYAYQYDDIWVYTRDRKFEYLKPFKAFGKINNIINLPDYED